MLDKGVIEPICSPWASPICLVRKKDQTIRFCIDFRKINSLSELEALPIPKIDSCLDALYSVKWMSMVDCQSGYWQVLMDQNDKPKTAFITHKGLFSLRSCPWD